MNSWSALLADEKQKEYFQQTLAYVNQRRAQGINVYPAEQEVFSAFDSPSFDQIKVVILGQDPYHGAGQAHGLCFSVKPGIKPPPSLVNIYKELQTDIADFQFPQHGDLRDWAAQGVFLLNTVLTVEEGQAHSHKKLGWEQFTDRVIELLSKKGEGIIFLLWGAHAQKKGKNIDANKHVILTAPHPSPLSAHRGFFGCQHFSKTNTYLQQLGKAPINWQI
ncbi:uracil-DNA glycosylase [Thalassotalea sp. 1_MG-2023]|uniref:uracil-DNA glycosylase n=1 Tax=Thalassotalea sp. 1_MG-2023 TaxID=3062680 RepID=UPI0026E25F5D|nr:uracil-DNA glycosylase [Thalassotalea sp. 1_MG-2023]MDO6425789.1 uracil-DNA glycosylase [Thalassotalea sp. 1_MG-2023]